MLRHFGSVRAVASEISETADEAIEDYREGLVTDEPQITDRMLGAVKSRLKSLEIRGVSWRAKTLRTYSGTANEERRHGADLLGVLDISLREYVVKKGFLAQAKRIEPGHSFRTKDWDRLISQCRTMLQRTPDAFVFLYSKAIGVRILPAISVLGAGSKDLYDLYHRGVRSFFELHLECFVGDARLDSPDIATLDLLADFPVRRALVVQASEAATDQEG